MRPVPMRELGSHRRRAHRPDARACSARCLLEDLDDATIAALTEAVGPGSGSPLPVVQIRHLGGAFARTPDGAGSHGPVTEPYNLFAFGVPAVPELVEVISMYFDRIERRRRRRGQWPHAAQLPGVGRGPRPCGGAQRPATASSEPSSASDPLQTIRSNRPVRG